jgi:hypothetical protein
MISKLRGNLHIFILVLAVAQLLFIGYNFARGNFTKKETSTENIVNTTEEEQITGADPNRFKSSETGLPVGTVIDKGELEGLPSSNYTSVKTVDGTISIIKNLEWQTHTAINIGDIIE